MLKKGQVSFFAIVGVFMVIVTAAILITNSRIGQSKLDAELNRQEALNEDRLLLEWYADEVIRDASLEAINNSNVSAGAIEAGINRLFNPEQFSRRGAVVAVGYPSVKLTFTGKYLIVDANLSVRIQRSWGSVGIESRSVRVTYNGTAE
ncbi:MAG: hypothetical protein V1702_03080 [Candidatus Woesearchaeota archaeon]